MKKTLAAVAVLGAFAGSAVAADVTLYGLVDYSLQYQHLDADVATADATDTTQMASGANSVSRFGLKGTEDLGNGVKVGFVLENGFAADTGALGNSSRLFDRESQLFVEGAFGRVAFGRFGQLASSLGSYGLLGVTGPFSTGWGDAPAGLKYVNANGHSRYDNAITYVTPSFGGLTVYAQYSSSVSNAGTENESDTDRAYGIGAKFVGAGLTLVGVVDSTNYQSFGKGAVSKDMDDALTVTLGGNYDFQVAKVYFGGQYFTNAKKVGQKNVSATSTMDKGYDFEKPYNGADGFGLGLGVGVPVMGGTFGAYAGYMKADAVDSTAADDMSVKRMIGAVGYTYSFSKRTSIYTSASYTKDKVEYADSTKDRDPSSVEVLLGMIHKF